jgi:hypothetical protein
MNDYQHTIPGGTGLAVTGTVFGLEGLAIAAGLTIVGAVLLRLGFRRSKAFAES